MANIRCYSQAYVLWDYVLMIYCIVWKSVWNILMLSETVRLSYADLCLNLSGPSDMEIIRKAQSRHKMHVSQTSASKLNKAMCHFPDVSITTSFFGICWGCCSPCWWCWLCCYSHWSQCTSGLFEREVTFFCVIIYSSICTFIQPYMEATCATHTTSKSPTSPPNTLSWTAPCGHMNFCSNCHSCH